MLPDLTNKRFVILGLQGSGKSQLAKHLLQHEQAHIVYDVMHEHSGFNRYIVKHRKHGKDGIDELNLFVQKVVIESKRIRLFILDEANRYCPPKPAPLPDSILELNDWQRHWNISFGSIARRPTQLNSDLTELANYKFIFQLTGVKDLAYLDSIVKGLGDQVLTLPPFHFVIVYPNHQTEIQAPIKLQ
jgi:DNA helicase HerA-like ATPase